MMVLNQEISISSSPMSYTHKLTQNDRALRCPSQVQRSGEGPARGKEHREERGENGSACSFHFPFFHRGAPTDRSSAQIHQQMLEISVSFNHGKKAQQATSHALHFIPSSFCLSGAALHPPKKCFNKRIDT